MYSICQQRIISHFEDALVSKTVRHAYVISGQRGLGKKTVSQKLKLLFGCKNLCACQSCEGCKSVLTGANPDIITLTNKGKNSYEIEQIRSLIKNVYEKPLVSPYKLIVLENAHLLGEKCQNALLKVIEEPPPYGVFVLLTDEVHAMLPTIMSRVMHMEILPWRQGELKTAMEAEEFLYKYSMGNIGTLVSLLGSGDFKNMRKEVLDEFESFLNGEEIGVYDITKSWADNKDRLMDALSVVTFFLRDVIFMKNGQTDLIINEDKKEAIARVSGKITMTQALKMAELLGAFPEKIRHNENASMMLQEMFTCIKQIQNKAQL